MRIGIRKRIVSVFLAAAMIMPLLSDIPAKADNAGDDGVQTITMFKEQELDEKYYTVGAAPSKENIISDLESNVSVVEAVTDEADGVKIPVTWDSEDYVSTEAGNYTFTAALASDRFVLGDGVKMPSISVVISMPVMAASDEEPEGIVKSIDKLSVMLMSGASRNSKGDYVWDVKNSASGHTFVFRVNFAASIQGKIDAAKVSEDGTSVTGGIQIRIPGSIIRNRGGNLDDSFESSLFSRSEIAQMDEEDAKEEDWAYITDNNGDIIVYNRKDLTKSPNEFFDIGFVTNSSTYSYPDYGSKNDASDGFYAEMTAQSASMTSALTEKTGEIKVYINTTATITSTYKNYPTQTSRWSSSWGTYKKTNSGDSDDGSDYYWQVWTIRSDIADSTSQTYNFTLKDTITSSKSPIGKNIGCEVYAYKMRGGSLCYASDYPDGVTVSGQTATDYRYDQVITRVKKSNVADLTSFTINNSVKATVDPADGVDADTNATSSQTFSWTRPTFSVPIGKFNIFKYGDENWDGYWNGSLHDEREYSSYDLDKFQEGKMDTIEDLEYAIWARGYAFPWTIKDGGSSKNYQDYGYKYVTYDITDSQFYPLNSDGTNIDSSDRDSSGNVKERFAGTDEPDEDDLEAASNGTIKALEADDYDIAYIDYDIYFMDAKRDENGVPVVDDDTENFIINGKSFTGSDVLNVYTKTGTGDYVLAATYNLGTKTLTKTEGSLVESMNSGRITFKKGVDGFRITNTNNYYYSNFVFYPYVTIYSTKNTKNWTGEGVLGASGSTSKNAVLLKNIANMKVAKGSSDSYDSDDVIVDISKMSGDRIRVTEKDSQITKTITKIGTGNNKATKSYDVGWRVSAYESYAEGKGGKADQHFIRQESGTFYDLLPAGATLKSGSVSVKIPSGSDTSVSFAEAESAYNSTLLSKNEYSVKTINNYGGSGRTLLVVDIKSSGAAYVVYYTTIHAWDSIIDYGTDALNPVAYETGNESIYGGFADDPAGTNNLGLKIGDEECNSSLRSKEDMEWFTNLDAASREEEYRFIYDDEVKDLSALMRGSAGLSKRVMAEDDAKWAYSTTVSPDDTYKYWLRYVNTSSAVTDMVLFDSVENYKDSGAVSEWKGTLTSIDVTQMKTALNADGSGNKLAPVVWVYCGQNVIDSSDEAFRSSFIDAGTDAEKTAAGWIKYADWEKNKVPVTAIAIDIRKDTAGNSFVLEAGGSVSAYYYMEAPHALPGDEGEETGGAQEETPGYPKTYNNVYMHLRETSVDNAYFIHYDYTTVKYIVAADFGLHKVSSKNEGESIRDIVFRLTGTSVYGTEVDEKIATDRNGEILFSKVERGTYILQEYESTDDWLLDPTEHTVIIDKDGRVTIDGDDYSGTEDGDAKYLTVADDPRVHTDIVLKKVDSIYTSQAVGGATYMLIGTSDYGTHYSEAAVTSTGDDGAAKGTLTFYNIEKGTYTLRETASPDGYILNNTLYTVTIDESGNFKISYETDIDDNT